MVKSSIHQWSNMAIGRSQIPQQIYGKLRGAKPSRAMMAAKRKKKK